MTEAYFKVEEERDEGEVRIFVRKMLGCDYGQAPCGAVWRMLRD
jgi:hypothetical protein